MENSLKFPNLTWKNHEDHPHSSKVTTPLLVHTEDSRSSHNVVAIMSALVMLIVMFYEKTAQNWRPSRHFQGTYHLSSHTCLLFLILPALCSLFEVPGNTPRGCCRRDIRSETSGLTTEVMIRHNWNSTYLKLCIELRKASYPPVSMSCVGSTSSWTHLNFLQNGWILCKVLDS